MPGMGTGLQANNATIVSAFESLLFHQGLVVLVLLALLAVAWNLLRSVQLRRASAGEAWPELWAYPEPIARRFLRVCFGLIWILDGFLQGQTSMPLGMTTQVIGPGAVTSPTWVQHLVNFGATIWSNHPITAPASAVWIQVGIGVWLLVAPRGRWSRLAGLSSVVWGIVVWVFGESFGGIFAPGLSWAFGAPGAVLFYCLAGVLVALPERFWLSPRIGRAILAVLGVFFVCMAVLQAWPGRGFWQGRLGHSTAGALTTMVQQMAQTPQPRVFASWVTSFARFDAAHGWAVNLFLVICLAALGSAFLSGRTRVVRLAVIGGIVICLADWVLIEDFGFFGGVGTDPNSMIPMALVFTAGYLALTRIPASVDAPVPITAASPATLSLWERFTKRPRYTLQSLAAVGAIGITLVGAAPMAVASMSPNADPILAEAVDGTPNSVHLLAPAFRLTDQSGATVSLRSLRGKVVALTFLDPVCVSDCPIIAQEFREADRLVGGAANRVELVAVVANPVYRSPAYLVAFDRQEGLDNVANWLYLTGSDSELVRVWDSFGVQVAYSPGGAMIAHSDIAYVIDANGYTRYVLDMDPGPGTASTKSSSAVVLANSIDSALGS
jgi:cytochrome oxidase Cu insertion factor (SCO1/SenC/PrrC family)